MTIDIDEFGRLDVRAGTVTRAEFHERARRPALRLWIDFGTGIGPKTSSAQIAARYRPEELVGRQVMAVVNLSPRRVAGFVSEVLVLGFPDASGEIVLAVPDAAVPDGSRLA
jgi:tRNA-binding protein